MQEEIDRLVLLSRMRKRAATEDSSTLWSIFNEESRDSTAVCSVGFAEVESSLYKRRLNFNFYLNTNF